MAIAGTIAIHRELHAWSVSLFLHGLLVVVLSTQILTSKTPLASEPFRWEVALVHPPLLATSVAASDDPISSSLKPADAVFASMPSSVNAAAANQLPVEERQPLEDPPRVHLVEPVPSTRVAEAPMPMNHPELWEPVQDSLPPLPFEREQNPVPSPLEKHQDTPHHPGSEIARVSQDHLAAAPVPADLPTNPTWGASSPEPNPIATPTMFPVAPAAATPASAARVDYGWLQRTLSKRLEELKRRNRPLLQQEGRVRILVRAVVTDQGELANAAVEQGSGEPRLDDAALALVRTAFPLSLERPLDRPQIAMKIPIVYQRE